jgi:hypothetical protein
LNIFCRRFNFSQCPIIHYLFLLQIHLAVGIGTW